MVLNLKLKGSARTSHEIENLSGRLGELKLATILPLLVFVVIVKLK